MSETKIEKPDTKRSTTFKEWIRIHFLSPYLRAIPKADKTLDLACGWGFSFKINPDFYGVEYDDACLSSLANKHKVRKGNILEELPYENLFFDNVFSHDVLEHFAKGELPTIFKNVSRVLKPGGRFINIIPNKLGYDFGLRINAGHKHFITPEEIKGIAQETGFVLEEVYASPFPKVFHTFFAHNKWVTVCRKLG